MFPYILQGDNLTIVVDHRQTTINKDTHPNFDKIVDAIRTDDEDLVRELVDITRAIKSYANGSLEVKDGDVYWDGEPFHNALTDRLLEMLKMSLPVEPLVNFLHNLKENPSRRAVLELYGFLEKNSLPITSDGHFLAYKKVNGNYMDIYSGQIDNSVGQVVTMARNEVDEDKDRTCSAGLHFCSLEYLPNYGMDSGIHVMILKINPRDVVSIPSDYNNAKGRCCRYEVVAEHETDGTRNYREAFDKPVHDYSATSPDWSGPRTPVRKVYRTTNRDGSYAYRYDDGTFAGRAAYAAWLEYKDSLS